MLHALLSILVRRGSTSFSSRGTFAIGVNADENNLRTFLQSVPNNNIVMGALVGETYSGV